MTGFTTNIYICPGGFIGIIGGALSADYMAQFEVVQQTDFLNAMTQGWFQASMLGMFLGAVLGTGVGAVVGGRNQERKLGA